MSSFSISVDSGVQHGGMGTNHHRWLIPSGGTDVVYTLYLHNDNKRIASVHLFQDAKKITVDPIVIPAHKVVHLYGRPIDNQALRIPTGAERSLIQADVVYIEPNKAALKRNVSYAAAATYRPAPMQTSRPIRYSLRLSVTHDKQTEITQDLEE